MANGFVNRRAFIAATGAAVLSTSADAQQDDTGITSASFAELHYATMRDLKRLIGTEPWGSPLAIESIVMYLSSREQIFKGEDHNYIKDLMIAINESPNIEAMLSKLEQLAQRVRSTASDAMKSLINLAISSTRRAKEFLDDHTELKIVVTTVLADITGAVTGFYTARSNPRFALFAAAASAVYSSYTAADSALKRR